VSAPATAAARLAALAPRLALLATGGAAVAVLLLTVPALAAPFVVPKLAALELAAALALAALGLHLGGGARPPLTRGVAVGAALVLLTTAASWAAAARTAEGAPYALAAFLRWAALLALAGAAAVVAGEARARQSLLEVVAAVTAVVSLIGLWQHLDLAPLPLPVISAPGSTFGNRNLAGEAIALALPLVLAGAAGAPAAAGRRLLLAAAGVALVYLAATRARGAWAGGAAGALTFLALVKPRPSARGAVLALALLAVAAAAALIPGRRNPRYAADTKRLAGPAEVAQASFDPRSVAVRTRLGLWRRTWAMAAAHPLAGVGPGNWPVFFPRYAEPGATADGVLGAALAPRQAHQDLLERAAETGAPGLAALLVLIGAAAVAARQRLRAGEAQARAATAGAAGALVALLVTGATGFPLEMPGTIALAGLALGLVAPGADGSGGGSESGAQAARASGSAAIARARLLGHATALLAAGLLVAAAARGGRQVRGSAYLGRAERVLRRDGSPEGGAGALKALVLAAAATPSSFPVQLRTAHMLLRLRRFPEATPAARRALALEPFSPNAWATLAVSQLGARDASASRASAARALELLHDYPFALWVHGQAARALDDAGAAAADHARLLQLATGGPAGEDTAAAAREVLRASGPEAPSPEAAP
jgi:O-antigen ligase